MEAKFRGVKEKTVYDIFYKIVRSRTTIRQNQINFLYNILAVLLKKKLYEEKLVKIAGFGKFYMFDGKEESVIRFKMFKKLKRIIHGLKQINFDKFYISYRTLNSLFINFSKCTGLKVKQSAFLFYVWVYALLQALVQEKGCKVKGMGFLYITKINYQKIRGIKRTVKYFYTVKFKAYRRTELEINGRKEMHFYKRIKMLLSLNNI